jgi:hypothetical protein
MVTQERRDRAEGDEPEMQGPSERAGPLESLREILVGGDRQRISGLEAQVEALERQVSDREALVALIAPVLTELIRRKIRDAREEMVETLYPIIGQVVVRAVQEAIRDLARTIDARMRSTFNPRVLWRRLRGRLSGVSAGEMALRSALPFKVTDMLLIHRETGLLLRHVTDDPEALPDSDLVSGMLTAIRDFVGDALGQGADEDEDLDAIEYGGERILIETSQHAYLAVVVDGIEPAGFRAAMREQVIEISQSYGETLREYDGDASALEAADGRLRSLVAPKEPPMLNKVQKHVLVGATGLLLVCVVGACLAGRSVWQSARVVPTLEAYLATETAAPTQTPVPTSTATSTATATATATSTPTATLTPTSTATPTATVTPTFTPTATPTVPATPTLTATPALSAGAVMTGSVYVRQGPGADSPLLGMVLTRGQAIEVVAVYGTWVQAQWTPQDGAHVVGWVPMTWVGVLTPFPDTIVTPTAAP